jgi:hypothetical protein
MIEIEALLIRFERLVAEIKRAVEERSTFYITFYLIQSEPRVESLHPFDLP